MIVGHIGGAGAPYEIQKSLRFRASASAYLSRTPSVAGNRKTWTWSGWVKRGSLGGDAVMFSQYVSATNFGLFRFSNPTDNIRIYEAQGGSAVMSLDTTAVFRDPSSHLHLVLSVDTTQATASNRVKLFVNGVQITTFTTATYPAQNLQLDFNRNLAHYVGQTGGSTQYFDGYLTEINFIDGQALDASYFGEVSAETGAWIPKKYTGTYGTNGFYLPFNDGSNLTNLTADRSGNGNNWTANNLSLTPGVTYDWMDDTPSNNFAVLNPLTVRGAGGTLSNGNLTVAATSASSPADTSMYGTVALRSNGLIYLEALYTVTAGTGNDTRIGVSTVGGVGAYVQAGSTTGYWSYDYKTGTANAQGSNTSYTAASTGQVVMWAIDVANGKIWAGANGVWFNSGNPAAGTGAVLTGVSTSAINLQTTLNGWSNRCSLDFNFGQRPFAYAPPTGFKALCTKNLPTGTITTSGTFSGNASTDGPFVYLNGVPTAMTINGNAVTFGNHADKLANGFKVRSSSASYNSAGSNTYSITSTGTKFKYSNAQGNP